jgi:Flp pilus assembly pilin Flp
LGRANEFRLLGVLVSIAVLSVISTVVVDLASVYQTVATGVEQALTTADDVANGRSQ